MEHPKNYERDEDIKLSPDPRNLDLTYSIVIWILARIINFLEFNNLSLNLIFFITINFTFGIMIVYMTALFSWKLKGILIFVFIMSGINVIYAIIVFTLPITINYELDPFGPIIVVIILLISIVAVRRVSRVYFSPATSSAS